VGVAVHGWDVHVSGVKGVVNNTLHATESLDRQAKSLGNEMNSAAGAAGIDIVQQALKSFADHAELVLPNIGKELNAVLNGAVTATRAYIEGDEHMAVRAERAAARATGWLPPLNAHSPRNDGRQP
jgi:Family of unknown function (DUF6507)